MLLLSHSSSSLEGPGEQERSWGLEEGQCQCSLGNGQEGGPRNAQGNHSFTSVTKKVMEWPILVVISEHVEGKRLIRNSEHGFTKGKFRFINLIAFNGMTAWVSEGTAVGGVCHDISQASDSFLSGKDA